MFYILDDNGNPVVEKDVEQWGRWFEKKDRHVAESEVNGHVVSTVFLGIDHSFCKPSVPILFETMIYIKKDGRFLHEFLDYQERYTTKEEALEGHKRAEDYVYQLSTENESKLSTSKRKIIIDEEDTSIS